MCFDYDALPPDLPLEAMEGLHGGAGASGIVSTEQIVLASQDGTKFAAYLARPVAASGAGIVILPDVRGLFRFYEELAERFASVGVAALAFDYFGRTAGAAERDAQFDYVPHVTQTKPEQVAQDVSAAITYLRAQTGAQALFTVGFCFGGTHSLHQAANHQGLSGVISFYGSPTSHRFGGSSPIERIGDMACPVLAFYGGADKGIPIEDTQRFDAALTQAGIAHEVVIYDGAPHSFFDRTYAQYQAESADAWRRSLAFIAAQTAVA